MSEQENKDADLTPFEAALASLAPRVEGFDRQRLMYLAGRESALRELRGGRRVGRWAWPAAFATMTAVAASLLVMVCIRPGPTIIVRETPPMTVAQQTDAIRPTGQAAAPKQPNDRANGDTYAELRQQMLRYGPELYRPRPAADSVGIAVAQGPLTYHELLEQLLGDQPQQ